LLTQAGDSVTPVGLLPHRHVGHRPGRDDRWRGRPRCRAPFAVLVAEQMFASGANLVVPITSAGQLQPLPETRCFVLIDKALRDEGTSLHYLPPEPWSVLPGHLKAALEPTLHDMD